MKVFNHSILSRQIIESIIYVGTVDEVMDQIRNQLDPSFKFQWRTPDEFYIYSIADDSSWLRKLQKVLPHTNEVRVQLVPNDRKTYVTLNIVHVTQIPESILHFGAMWLFCLVVFGFFGFHLVESSILPPGKFGSLMAMFMPPILLVIPLQFFATQVGAKMSKELTGVIKTYLQSIDTDPDIG